MHALNSIILITSALVAQEAEAAPNMIAQFMPIIVMFVIFYVVLIAPQRREAKERDKMREELKKGDDVVTGAGIHGQVVGGDKHTVTLKVDTKVELVFDRSAVARLEKKAEGSATPLANDSAKSAPPRAGEAKK